jgi:hypothetical protein
MSPDLERLLREARSALPSPSARSTNEARDAVIGSLLRRRRGRLRATAAVVVLGLATAIGIVAGLLVAPSGGASSPAGVTGLGFLPAKGWTVVQSAPGQALESTAVASNVQIRPRDVPLDGPPLATIRSLGDHGVVVFAKFTARGNIWNDLGYPTAAGVPQLDEGYRETSWNAQIRPEDPVAQYLLQFSNAGYNVELRVYVGRLHPTTQQLRNVQQQLDRLIVAGEPVTIQVTPTTAAWSARVSFSGAISNGRANEDVDIEERRCGSSAWTPVVSTHTDQGGSWHVEWGVMITSSFRAIWDNKVSNAVTVRKRPGITVRQTAPTRFHVGIFALKSFEGRTGALERFDPKRGRWYTVKRFRFTDSGANTGVTIGTSARVPAFVKPGTLVRAVLPRAAAAPCYLAGYSNLLRTTSAG